MKNRGRVIFFTDCLPPAIGGMEVHAEAFIDHFSKPRNGELAAIMTFAPGAPKDGSVVAESIPSMPAPTVFLSPDSIFSPHEVLCELDRIAPTDNDVFFFNSLYWIRILPALKEQYPLVRIIMRSGGNDILQANIDGTGATLSQRQQFIVRTINTVVDRLIVNSEYAFAAFSRLGISDLRMVIVQGGVDTSRFTPHSPMERFALRKKLSLPLDEPILLAVCRLVPFKGLMYSIDAVQQLPAETPAHYVIVGSGPLSQELTSYVAAAPFPNRISFVPSVPHQNIHAYFHAADIYVLTPVLHEQKVPGGSYIHTETMGRSFCEAAASGLPAIGTQVGGIPEILWNDITGITVPERSSGAVATAISALFANLQKRAKMGEQARTRSIQLSWEKIFAQYQTIFWP